MRLLLVNLLVLLAQAQSSDHDTKSKRFEVAKEQIDLVKEIDKLIGSHFQESPEDMKKAAEEDKDKMELLRITISQLKKLSEQWQLLREYHQTSAALRSQIKFSEQPNRELTIDEKLRIWNESRKQAEAKNLHFEVPKPVQDTDEVRRAREEHLRLYEKTLKQHN